jgi:CHAT domain-containing protein/Flp pilus assembly protein TadD
MRSNIFASGLAIVLSVGSPMVSAVVSPEAATAQSTANLNTQSVQLLAKGKEQYRQADFRSAIATYQRALTIGQQTKDRATQIDALLQLGSIDFSIGHVPESEANLRQGLNLAKESSDRRREGELIAAIGIIARQKAQYSQAMELLKQSLAIAQQVKNPRGETQSRLAIGTVLYMQNQYPHAMEEFQKALKIAQALPDQDETVYIQAWLTIAYVATKDFKQAEAMSLQQQALSRSIGHRLAEYEGLSAIVVLRQQQKTLDQVLQTYQQQLVVAKSANNPWFQKDTLGNIGLVYYGLGEKQKALEYYNQALPVLRAVGDRSGEATTLNNFGLVYFDLGEMQKALEYYNQALPIHRAVGNRSGEGTTFHNIGLVYSNLGEKQKALEYYNQALPIRRAVGDRSGEATTLNYIGLVYSNLGEKQKALEYYNQALPIFRAVGDRSGEAGTFSGVGLVYSDLGEKQKALEYYNQALLLRRTVGDRSGEATTLNNIGGVYYALGEKQKALEYYNQALPIRRASPDRSGEATILANIGVVYSSLGENQKALKYYDQVLPIFRAMSDRASEATTLNNIGLVYDNLGEKQRALEYYNQALSIHRAVGNRNGEATALYNVGGIYYALGEKQKALKYYHQALPILRAVGDRSTEATILNNIGSVFTFQNQPQLAAVFYKQSVIIYETLRKDIRKLPQETQKIYTKTVENPYRSLADLLIQQNRLLEAQQVLDLLKLQEIKDYSPTTRNALADSEIKLTETEQSIAKQYGTLIAFRQKLDQCQGKINNTECDKFDRDRDQQGKAFNDFLASLKSQVTDRCQKNQEENCIAPSNKFTSAANKMIAAQPGSLIIMPVVLDDKIWILTIGENGIITRYESKVDRIKLGKKVVELRQQLETPNSDIKALQTTSKQLYDWLIRPIEPTIQSAKTPPKLIFALDRVTRYIPMGVLYDGQQYLTQRYPISTILSIETTNTNKSTIGNLNSTNVLALGLTKAVSDFRALPSVNPEIASIVQKTGIYPGQILLDRDFTRSNLSNNLNNRNILHIATHGKFDPTNPKGSFLVLGNGDKLPIADISTLDYSKLDLVVLSACQTALGNPDQDGTEIPGISSHFLNNGAASVMASLWSVDDSSTALMMQSFYRNLSQNKPKNEALRQAQLDLLKLDTAQATQSAIGSLPRFTFEGPTTPAKKIDRAPGYSHPYYWAPFILMGNSQ